MQEAMKKESNMVFQFEHMDVDSDEKSGKWTTRKMDLRGPEKSLHAGAASSGYY